MNEIDYIFKNKIFISDKSQKYNSYTWEKNNVYQLYVIEFFYNIIPKDKKTIVLDIGSQSGAFSLLAKFIPNSIWHSFEPDLINYNCLLENIKLNNIDNINTYNIGIGAKSEYKTLNINPNHRGLNTFGENIINFDINSAEKSNIKIKTIDELFLNTKVDLIKIDTEGSEYDILLGGLEVIKKYKPKILMEYHNQNLQQFSKNINQLEQLIYDINYTITWKEEDNILIEFI